jgi:hypothetical protein
MNNSEKIKYINIDTRFRDDFCIENHEYKISIPHEIHNVKSITIACMEIPITFHNISSFMGNDCFYITICDTSGNDIHKCKVIIPNGNYNSTSIVDMISRLLQKNENTKELSVRLNSSNIIEFISTSLDRIYSIHFTQVRMFDNNPCKTLGQMLGFYSPIYTMTAADASNNIVVIADNICDFTHPRYLFLDIYENERRNQYTFTSSLVCNQRMKHAIARIAIDQRNFPYGSIITANTFNGLLISDTRIYERPVDLRKFYVRLVNEYGVPILLNDFEFSFCITALTQ